MGPLVRPGERGGDQADHDSTALSSLQLALVFDIGGSTRKIKGHLLPDGVTVTQRPLEALFMVRIHVG